MFGGPPSKHSSKWSVVCDRCEKIKPLLESFYFFVLALCLDPDPYALYPLMQPTAFRRATFREMPAPWTASTTSSMFL